MAMMDFFRSKPETKTRREKIEKMTVAEALREQDIVNAYVDAARSEEDEKFKLAEKIAAAERRRRYSAEAIRELNLDDDPMLDEWGVLIEAEAEGAVRRGPDGVKGPNAVAPKYMPRVAPAKRLKPPEAYGGTKAEGVWWEYRMTPPAAGAIDSKDRVRYYQSKETFERVRKGLEAKGWTASRRRVERWESI